MGNITDLGAYYEEWWENPRDPRTPVFEALNRLIRERIPAGRCRRALDLGSGKGTIVSYLLEKGYDVTAVEGHPPLARRLRELFPHVQVIAADVRSVELERRYDLVTCIELAQNLRVEELRHLVRKLRPHAEALFINISNANSFHGAWVRVRRFRAPFVFLHTPGNLESALRDGGFAVTYCRGVGALTPITLRSEFRGRILPPGLVKATNRLLDPILPANCHLYYVEAS